MTAFEEMGVLPEIAKAVDEMDWMLPMDVQAEAIPLILGGGDVLMAAETGSGKTGAFCLPIIQIVWETLKDLEAGKGSKVIAQTSPHWTLSFFDRGHAMAVTPDGLRCQSREQKEWHGCRATKGVQGKGRYYYEATVTDEGLCRVGWSTLQANLDLGTDKFGFGFGGTGKKSNNKQFDSYGEEFGIHDTIGCFLDLDSGEIKFSKNGVDLGKAFSIPPQIKNSAFFPAVVLKECAICPGAELMTVEALHLQDTDNDVTYALSEGGELVKKTIEPEKFVTEVKHWVMKGIADHHIWRIQRQAIAEVKPATSQNTDTFVLQHDFAEKWSVALQNEIQNYHRHTSQNAEMSFNFGTQPFKHPPTDGYLAICEAPKEYVKQNETGTGAASSQSKSVKNAPQAIVIEPSRELAEQTYNQIIKFKKYLENPKVRELLVIGGVNVKDQIAALMAGVDIVVGTPGRLEDLISAGHLSLTQCRFFVLDEADGLLKQGYTELIDRLHRQIPKITSDGRRLQMIVCSATLHAFEVKKMAERLMHFPTWVDLKGEDAVPETVHHVVVMVDPQKDSNWHNLRRHIQTDGVHARDNVRPGNNTAETLSEAVKMLKGEYCMRAINEHKMDRAIIFCRTKLDCDNLEKYMNQLGGGPHNRGNPYSCVCLHGDRKPAERKSNLEKFKRQEVKFLICTDVAARGLDISGLPFMINVTLPDEKSNYVHRIGRVGRAERMGLAISLVSSVPEKVWYHGEWCPSRGRNCHNTRLTDEGGCCIWYNEPQYLADIEDHLNVTIQQVEPDLKVPVDEFDGKVVYGQKRQNVGSSYENHVAQMAPSVKELAQLESKAQLIYLKRQYIKEGRAW